MATNKVQYAQIMCTNWPWLTR